MITQRPVPVNQLVNFIPTLRSTQGWTKVEEGALAMAVSRGGNDVGRVTEFLNARELGKDELGFVYKK